MNVTANTILITGGATGIGLALARLLLQKGNQVIICGRREAALQKAQEEAPGLVTHICDVADAESRRSMVEWLKASHAGLNVVINNAGVQYRRDFRHDPAVESLDQEVAINLTAPIHLIAELLPTLSQHDEAFIINISSGLAFSPMARRYRPWWQYAQRRNCQPHDGLSGRIRQRGACAARSGQGRDSRRHLG